MLTNVLFVAIHIRVAGLHTLATHAAVQRFISINAVSVLPPGEWVWFSIATRRQTPTECETYALRCLPTL